MKAGAARTLALKSETLSALDDSELVGVVAGNWSGARDTCAHCLVSDRLNSVCDCPTLFCSERTDA